MIVLSIYEFVPWFTWLGTDQVIIMVVKSQAILVDIGEKVISSKNFCNLHQLIVVIASLEERLLFENHPCKHASK